jgi:hypothetical protein
MKKFRLDDESLSDYGNDDLWWAVGRVYVLSEYLEVQNLKKYLVDLVFRKGLPNSTLTQQISAVHHQE